jgi:putative flippase GtrA
MRGWRSGSKKLPVDLRQLGRHQVAAGLATAVDFGLMVALVELMRLPPAVATFLSAAGGGVSNFTFSRFWAFRDKHTGSMSSQATRYAMVSFGGAVLNAALVGAVLLAAHVPYVLVRAAVAIGVSLLYTYPMHTRFVFRVSAPDTSRARADESALQLGGTHEPFDGRVDAEGDLELAPAFSESVPTQLRSAVREEAS